MFTILDRIIATKRLEVESAVGRISQGELERRAERTPPARDFFAAVTGSQGLRVIAEIKKASPSGGTIRATFDPLEIARIYYRHGAAALSVLTDETYFQGRLDYLAQVKGEVPLPVLRKDFIITEYQLFESRAAGADAVLLIAEVLGVEKITKWIPTCRQMGLGVLVEVHSEVHLREVLNCVGIPSPQSYLLGINNRDLALQRTDIHTTARLAAELPKGTPFVSESGISTRDDVLTVQHAGACAILVGESLLRAANIGLKLDSLLNR